MPNKSFIINGIKNLLTKNYHIPNDIIDLEAEIDHNLSMSENWSIIKSKLGLNTLDIRCPHCGIIIGDFYEKKLRCKYITLNGIRCKCHGEMFGFCGNHYWVNKRKTDPESIKKKPVLNLYRCDFIETTKKIKRNNDNIEYTRSLD